MVYIMSLKEILIYLIPKNNIISKLLLHYKKKIKKWGERKYMNKMFRIKKNDYRRPIDKSPIENPSISYINSFSPHSLAKLHYSSLWGNFPIIILLQYSSAVKHEFDFHFNCHTIIFIFHGLVIIVLFSLVLYFNFLFFPRFSTSDIYN